jgi:hypothetical protein
LHQNFKKCGISENFLRKSDGWNYSHLKKSLGMIFLLTKFSTAGRFISRFNAIITLSKLKFATTKHNFQWKSDWLSGVTRARYCWNHSRRSQFFHNNLTVLISHHSRKISDCSPSKSQRKHFNNTSQQFVEKFDIVRIIEKDSELLIKIHIKWFVFFRIDRAKMKWQTQICLRTEESFPDSFNPPIFNFWFISEWISHRH